MATVEDVRDSGELKSEADRKGFASAREIPDSRATERGGRTIKCILTVASYGNVISCSCSETRRGHRAIALQGV